MRRPEALVPAQINATSKWFPPPPQAGRSTPLFAVIRPARNDGPSLALLHEFRNEATIMSGEEGRVPLPDGDEGKKGVDLSGRYGR